MSTEGGCYAFFATFRPRDGITDATIGRLVQRAPELCSYWFIVEEKEGVERHAHAVLFPKKPQQRSNLITMLTRTVISDWTADEKKNFRRWDKQRKTGAVKTVTHLECITDYLDGTRASKSEDKYAIIDQKLPSDLGQLEKYLPDVGKLKKPKNQWCHHWHKLFVDRFNWPMTKGRPRSPESAYAVSYSYVMSCVMHLENQDVLEIMLDDRIRRMKVRAFTRWWNGDIRGGDLIDDFEDFRPKNPDELEWSLG